MKLEQNLPCFKLSHGFEVCCCDLMPKTYWAMSQNNFWYVSATCLGPMPRGTSFVISIFNFIWQCSLVNISMWCDKRIDRTRWSYRVRIYIPCVRWRSIWVITNNVLRSWWNHFRFFFSWDDQLKEINCR